ncbi:MAG TPA: beta-propeller fold lactonase family protein [Gaiellaceae bacterium]|nr:beta-propeller fold lactonase family protein [Gaiellaceae bacterium]
MFGTKTRAVVVALVALLALALAPGATAARDGGLRAVFALTNDPAGNAVVVYARGGDGSLEPAGAYPTGGAGTGAGLGSQGAVIVSDDARFLFAVNAGSNSISSFRIGGSGLELVDVAPSGGTAPTSVAYHDGLLYVLNTGAPNNVSGLTVSRRGKLTPLAGSTRPLSADSTAPAQVGFSADGDVVIVSERATNRLVSYTVGRKGLLSAPIVHASAGPTPFGFAVTKRDTLLVSEAGAGGGASSYRIGRDGALDPASSNVMTGQRAACWAVATKNGRFGYVTNAGTGTISGFAVAKDGEATLLDADGVTAATGGNPTDAALSGNSRFLYVRVAALSQIAIFRIASDGSLQALPALTGTQAGLAGLAAT